MAFRNLQLLDIYPPSACVKIGDTISDIEEGKNPGMWTIGLLRTGNLVSLDQIAWGALSANEQTERLAQARSIMTQAAADYVAESLASCESILEEIDQRAMPR